VSASLWSARRLLLTISSQSASTFANQVVAFVIPWLVLSRTGSALNAGGVAFATGVASVLGTLFGGVIVDRIGGRRTAIVSDASAWSPCSPWWRRSSPTTCRCG
jgi:MFS family permease